MRISYDYGKLYTFKARTENVSTIIDKLVRLAAKLTESYASDIVYVANFLKNSIENQRPLAMVLNFREGGVDHFLMEASKGLSQPVFLDSLQVWLLTVEYANGEPKTTLKRVEIAEN